MIRISARDRYTQMWIEEKLQQGEEWNNYSYYSDISKEKFLKDVYKTIQDAAKSGLYQFKKAIKLYPDIEIKYAKDIGGQAIARYIAETSTNVPIVLIGVDSILKQLKKDAKKWSMDTSPEGIHNFIVREIYPAIIISIFHELGHAMVDELRSWFNSEKSEDLVYDNEESLVEDFARELYDDGLITDDMKNVIKDIKTIRKGGSIEA